MQIDVFCCFPVAGGVCGSGDDNTVGLVIGYKSSEDQIEGVARLLEAPGIVMTDGVRMGNGVSY